MLDRSRQPDMGAFERVLFWLYENSWWILPASVVAAIGGLHFL
jgi:hypothetical protein